MRFVVICAPRTGSSHLVSLLSGHPDMFVNGNVFDSRKLKRLYAFWPPEDLTPAVKKELTDLRSRDADAFLERIFSTDYGRSNVGFKIFDGENDEILNKLIEDSSIRKIVLYRSNVLANFSSSLVAAKVGMWGQKEGRSAPPPPKVKFDAERFVRFHDEYTGFFRKVIERLNAANQIFYFLDYEKINEPYLLRSLIAFIGADPEKEVRHENQYKRLVKQNSSDILSRFSNANKVRRFLLEHELLHWMHEGELDFAPLSDRGMLIPLTQVERDLVDRRPERAGVLDVSGPTRSR